VLATLSGASFSLDAAPFDRGDASPRIGAFVLVVDPSRFAGSVDRLAGRLERLRDEQQVRLPAVEATATADSAEIDTELLQRLRAAATPVRRRSTGCRTSG
jgi:(2R)-3-sulfolactate dehydrogenase (NADP+)